MKKGDLETSYLTEYNKGSRDRKRRTHLPNEPVWINDRTGRGELVKGEKYKGPHEIEPCGAMLLISCCNREEYILWLSKRDVFCLIFTLYSVLVQAYVCRFYGQNGITLINCMNIIETNHLNGTLVTGWMCSDYQNEWYPSQLF